MMLTRIAAALLLVSSQIGCTHAGESRSPTATDSPDCAMRTAAAPDCEPGGTSKPALQPAVPPVPASPIKVDCAKLPTQVERDTCTNQKEATG